MYTKHNFLVPFITIVLFLSQFSLIAQDTTKSLAFKNNRPYRNNPYFYQPDLSYQLLQQFKLVQIANSGDPLAQHELGLRLLTGEGIAADTVTAVYWIKKAASQKLTSALYNYGIMLINGWGTDWNPFAAYDNFLLAAQSGMKEAQYIIGILYTDNLIVKRDWNKSYYWIKKSSNAGYEPAKPVLLEVEPRVSISFKDSVDGNKFVLANDNFSKQNDDSKIKPSFGLVFIDFDMQSDTVQDISDNILISDLTKLDIPIIQDSLHLENDSTLTAFYEKDKINLLNKLADFGSHEAQTILGKLYQDGNYIGSNKLLAAEFYIRATILDSPRAAFLLWKLIRDKDFYNILNSAVQLNDPTAQFVWYGLKKLGYDNRLNDKDAIDLLQKAALQNHVPAIIELGFNFYTGKYVKQDKQKGIDLWKQAEKLKSVEASVRIAASKIFESNLNDDIKNEIALIIKSEKTGSILAQFTLAHCYDNGIGVTRDIPTAVKYYRDAAQRGNQFAFEQLKRLYDNIRPINEIFKMD
ncbi:MAG: tetratricopeptide repeat protein [Ignavibacteriaceae bacterium]